MSRLKWGAPGERRYETGVDRGVLYRQNKQGIYNTGEAWNGLTAVTESPSGAEANPQYADNGKYLNLVSAEEFNGTIEAFTYPKSFEECDGSKEISPGVTIGQQNRRPFGFSYRTRIGNDIEGTDYGYKLHFVYGSLAAPSEKAYATINDSPEALAFSWEFSTTPVDAGDDNKPTATIVVDITKIDPAKLKQLEDIIYGTTGVDARLPLPQEIFDILTEDLVEVKPTSPTYDVGTHVVTIPTLAGVVYTVEGEEVTGTITLTVGQSILVEADPLSGYRFPNPTDSDWLFEY